MSGRLVHTADANGFVNVADTDWFLAQLDASVTYRFELAWSKAYFLLAISDHEGRQLESSAITGIPVGQGTTRPGTYYANPDRTGILTYTPADTGTYYVSVSAPKGGLGTREYSLSARIIIP